MPDRDPLTGVPASRHPFQFWALAACSASGFSTAFDFGQPGTLVELMPEYMVLLWGYTNMLGGLLGLAASFWKDRITGLLLERLALFAVGGVMFVYGAVLYFVAGEPGYVASSFCVGIAFASWWRIVHVNRELKVLTRWIGEHFA